jgi:hypothetical protein
MGARDDERARAYRVSTLQHRSSLVNKVFSRRGKDGETRGPR